MFSKLKQALGRVLNKVGAPGFIRPRECQTRLGVPVEIRVEDRFTVVIVDNLRLMFNRLTGQFDGLIVEAEGCHPVANEASDTSYSAPTPR